MSARTLTDVTHLGLGAILRNHKLSVPPNQREYSWEEKHVTTLLLDFAAAILEGSEEYFLGTIVVVSKGENVYEIVDGQQRLATTAILLAAIRNYLRPIEPVIAESIDRDFLTSSSASRRDNESKIALNLVDNEFFRGMITGATIPPTKPSHELLEDAFTQATKQVKKIVAALDVKQHGDVLVNWVKFIEFKAQVVMLTISSEGNAYRMFETLNDRGLKTTQADLVKNYLFSRAESRLAEAQDKWSMMRGALEAVDEDEVPTVTYLRHALMLKRGYFREGDLHEHVKLEARSPSTVITLLNTLENLAADYAALFNPESERWNGYTDSMRDAIRTMSRLSLVGMRPLMLAVAAKFSKKEAAIAYRKFVSWHVRFLISGTTLTGGYLEVPLALAAKKVYDEEIQDEKALSKELAPRIPNDEQFERAFQEATVSKPALARYYLRALEMAASNQPDAWHVPNDDAQMITLEHILPQKPGNNWPDFTPPEAKADYKRIGNMVLLRAKLNSELRSAGFEEKRAVYQNTPYLLTSPIADDAGWNHQRIVDRQRVLAEFALKAWPL